MRIYLAVFVLLLIPLLGFAQEERATVYFPNGQSYSCEIADSAEERSVGLSKHDSLQEGSGMLIIYPRPSYTSFWMPPYMKFHLDIIFTDSQFRILHISQNAQPCRTNNPAECECYSPVMEVCYVLEIRAHEAARNGLNVGDTLRVAFPAGYYPPRY